VLEGVLELVESSEIPALRYRSRVEGLEFRVLHHCLFTSSNTPLLL
jgi:hypothetical protein